MATSQHSQLSVALERGRQELPDHVLEPPMNVKEAAKFLGVSPQTVYLWVERKQIPHLRVMGRTSGSSNRISSHSALHSDRRW